MKVIRIAPLVNALFIGFILFISLIAVRWRFVTVGSIELSYSNLVVLGVFVILFPLFFKHKLRAKSARRVFGLLAFILLYAFMSTSWASYNVDYWYIFYQLALAALTITIPYLVSTIINDKHVDPSRLISNFSLVLTGIYVFYMTQMTQGERLTGYLAGAALIHAIMIPTLAVHVGNIARKRRVLLSLICVFLTMLALFLTESRMGLLVLILFGLLLIFRKASIKRFLVVALLSAAFIPIILNFASTERYNKGLDDPLRSENIQTGADYAFQSASTFLFGNGYGSIWQWYAYERGMILDWPYPEPLMMTEFGYILAHPHSVFLGLFAELGLTGILPFIAVLLLIVREFWRSNKAKEEMRATILGAIICTFPSLHTDMFLFRNWEISIVWLFFLFTALSLPKPDADLAKS